MARLRPRNFRAARSKRAAMAMLRPTLATTVVTIKTELIRFLVLGGAPRFGGAGDPLGPEEGRRRTATGWSNFPQRPGFR